MPDQITALDYEISSQFAHFSTAAFLVTLFGSWYGPIGLMSAAIAMSLWAGVKEFWYDEKYESPLVRGSSLLDFIMYTAGTATAIGLYIVKHHA